ncbi:hypothetical protein KI387_002286, partial [Taxus chinensis]
MEIRDAPRTLVVGGLVKKMVGSGCGDRVDRMAGWEEHFEFFSELEGTTLKDQRLGKICDGYADCWPPFRGREVDIINGKLKDFLGPDSTQPLGSSAFDFGEVGWTEVHQKNPMLRVLALERLLM